MSRKAEASAMGMAERAEGAAGRKKKAGPVAYCGPTVRKMETAGTAEAILYHKIKSEL